MVTNRDLTTAHYWDGVWNENQSRTGSLPTLRRISQWKYDRMIGRLLDTAASPDGELLELGCAPGEMLRRINRLRPKLGLSGVDYAEDGCRLTGEVLRTMGLPPQVHYGDIRTIELSRQFDIVTSFGLIEHFDNPVEILECHKRFCARGGTIAVTVPNYASPVIRAFANAFCPDSLAIHNLKIMNVKSLRQAMRAVGLKNIRAGGDGGGKLHLGVSRHNLASKSYVFAGKIWNAGSVFVPPQLAWNSYLWATGQV